MLSVITREKHAAKLAVIHHPHVDRVGIFLIRHDRGYVAVGISVIGSRPCSGPVARRQNPAAIGRQQNAVRVSRIDEYIVDGAVNFVSEGVLAAGSKLRTLQTGRIQNYVYGLLGGVAFFSIVQYFLK